MKLHIHQANRNGQRYHAYTRDKSGKLLKRASISEQNGTNQVFLKHDWSYFRPLHFEVLNANTPIHKIYETVLQNGVCIAKVEKFPKKVFVFDAKFDHADARIYSLEKDLSSFHRFFGDIKLSPEGDTIGYDEIELKGSISERYYFKIQDLGVDLDQIAKASFAIVFLDRSVQPKEHFRRYLQRKLREDMPNILGDKFGIDLQEIKVGNVDFWPDQWQYDKPKGNEAYNQGLKSISYSIPGNTDAALGKHRLLQSPFLVYDDLHEKLLALAILPPHPRGYAFQSFLYTLFEVHGTNPRKSFRNRGEEIDGSFSMGGHAYVGS